MAWRNVDFYKDHAYQNFSIVNRSSLVVKLVGMVPKTMFYCGGHGCRIISEKVCYGYLVVLKATCPHHHPGVTLDDEDLEKRKKDGFF
jgi:hypothetical protein